MTISDTDKEALTRIFTRIPHMNKFIADPARHEKILSYVKSKANTMSNFIIHNLNGFEVIKVCINHEDERVVSMSMRIFGYLIKGLEQSCSNPKQLLAENSQLTIEQNEIKALIIEYVINQAKSSYTSSIVLFGCLECLQLIQEDKRQFNQEIFENASRTTNSFVFDSFAKLFSEYDVLDYLNNLANGAVDDQMRFCRFVEIFIETSKDDKDEYESAKRSQIKKEISKMLIDMALGTDRLVHMRAVSLLQKLKFDIKYLIYRVNHVNQRNIISALGALKLLPLNKGRFAFKVVEYLVGGSSDVVTDNMLDYPYRDEILEGLDLDNIFIQIMNSSQKEEILCKILQLAISSNHLTCEWVFLIQLIPKKSKRIEQLQFELIDKIVSQGYEGALSNCESTNISLAPLYKFVVYSLQNTRVLPILLKILFKLQEFIDVIFFNKESFCLVFLKLFNEWQNADSAIMFLVEIFSTCGFSSYNHPDYHGSCGSDCIKMILLNGIPQAICDQLSNENYYVRSQAVLLLTVVMETNYWDQWLLKCDPIEALRKRLLPVKNLPLLKHNDGNAENILIEKEPVVLGSLIKLLKQAVGSGLVGKILSKNENPAIAGKNKKVNHFLDRDLLDTLIRNDDSEIRAGAVELLNVIFFTLSDTSDLFDYQLVLDSLIHDHSRIVRAKVLEFISMVQVSFNEVGTDACQMNLFFEQMEFIKNCQLIDVELGLLKCQSQHLYQEALDMDESVMVEDDDLGDGNNVMFCYDC